MQKSTHFAFRPRTFSPARNKLSRKDASLSAKFMKYLVLLLDGAADEPVEELGFRTPLEVAKKPYMNFLAQNGEVGMLNPTPRGCTGGSDTGNMCVLGFNPAQYLTGRSPLEAASLGIKMEEDDVALRANLVTLSGDGPYEQKIMEDYSADEISTEEAAQLIACLEQHFGSETLRFYPGFSYRHCVIMHHATANEQLTPPHNITGRCIKDYMPKGDYADMLTDIMIRSNKLLSDHPVNLARAAKGKRTANSVWFWGQGTKPMLPSFRERHGLNGAVVTAVDLVKGLAFLTGMKIYPVEGATGTLDTNFAGKAQAAIQAFKDGFDLVYLHLEAPDECGHRHEVEGKVKAIEEIDSKVLAPVYKYLKSQGDFGILVTPDHPTPLTTRAHSNAPVPFIIYRSDVAPIAPAENYCEAAAKKNAVVLNEGYMAISRMILAGKPFL